ncbi:MAG: transposase [Deltaproteobacteria bacterium]|nr:transposase [Deltaproteobacteria bacterium]
MPDTTTATRWRAVVEAHAASGLTNRDFSRQHGVNPSSLAWWRSRLRDNDMKQTPTTATCPHRYCIVSPPKQWGRSDQQSVTLPAGGHHAPAPPPHRP